MAYEVTMYGRLPLAERMRGMIPYVRQADYHGVN